MEGKFLLVIVIENLKSYDEGLLVLRFWSVIARGHFDLFEATITNRVFPIQLNFFAAKPSYIFSEPFDFLNYFLKVCRSSM